MKFLGTSRCLVIGEVAQAHDGSLGMAHAFVDAIADTGADAVKFQTHIADAESTPYEPWRVKFSKQDAMRFDYWKRMEFTEAQWRGLKRNAKEKGLLFLSSPFSLEAIDLLKRVGVDAWKIASGETDSIFMFDRILATNQPVILSTGMSPLQEIDKAVEKIRAVGSQFAVLQCTSMYPTPPEKIGLNMIPILRDRFSCPIGLSDHSGTIYSALAAVALGASVIEVHVTFSNEMFGPDVPASITIQEFKMLVNGIRFIERIIENPIDKDQMAEDLGEMRNLFMKSVVANEDLEAGTLLELKHLAAKKPGTGIPGEQLPKLIGRELLCTVKADQQISESMIGDEPS